MPSSVLNGYSRTQKGWFLFLLDQLSVTFILGVYVLQVMHLLVLQLPVFPLQFRLQILPHLRILALTFLSPCEKVLVIDMEFLTAIVSSIAGEIAKYTVAPIGRQIGYLIFYDRNINNLKTKLQKLHDKKTGVDLQVNHAERNLYDPPPEVKTWQHQVVTVHVEATKFLEDEEIERKKRCFSGPCRNPKSLHSLSRKATKMSQDVVALLEDAEKFQFSEFACPRPPPALGSTFHTEGIKDFGSRVSLMKDVLKALMDDNLSMISICGLGGVGKTTMVKEIVKVVETQKLFDEVAMPVVSQNPNLKKIQGDIASCLGLELKDDTEKGRALKLHERIANNEKRILLILDDVWNEIDFEEIGIPAADESKIKCKIVLTSRREDECNKMGSQKNFRIHALSNAEGWDLFKGIAFADDSVDNQDLHQMAKQIAAECDGLPIAIVTIAKALKKKRESVWFDALNQLQRSNLKGVSGMGKVYSRLELSYDLLERGEAKSCFLLCCLFPEDYDIRVEDLVRYGMGLRLLENIESIQQARHRVHALVDELKDSFLLLDSDKDDHDQYVKMHDVIRDMAISIASKEKSYIVSCNDEMKKWPETDRYEDCHAISLRCKQMKEHPSDLNCPKLELVRLQYQKGLKRLPDNFFKGMKELKVLDLDIPSLPDSLPVLEKLRTLYLSDMAEIGDVRNVEILTIRDECFPMIPKEVGSMGKLRLLDLRGMSRLRYIPRGVLSRLSSLEELYAGSFMEWESSVYYDSDSSVEFEEDYCGIGGKVNASLDELESLPLTSLQISVPEPSVLPTESVLKNLARFRIVIKINLFAEGRTLGSMDSENGLRLEGDASAIKRSGICVLLKKTEDLILYSVRNLKSVWHELENDGFPQLKWISIEECRTLQHLVNISHISSSSQLPCFSNLRDITIASCDNLNYLFPVSMARRLSQLRRIYVYGCQRMDGLFYGKEEDDEVEFPNLIKLELKSLPELKGLLVDMDNAATNSSVIPGKMSISFLSRWIRLSNLQELVMERCHLVNVAFSIFVVEQLVQLKTLKIRYCKQMEYIIGGEDVEKHTRTSRLVFPMLISINISDLPELASFCQDSNFFWDWNSLKEIQIDKCPKMKTLVAQTQIIPSTSNQTVASIKEVIPNESQTRTESSSSHSSRNWHVELVSILFWSSWIRLSNLQKLVLGGCNSLKVIFSISVAEQLLHLRTLTIQVCKEVEYIVATLPGQEEEEEKHTRTSKLVFPMLTSIHIFNLPQLVTFSADARVSLDGHSLKEIQVHYCPKMKTLIALNQSTSTLDQSLLSINEMLFKIAPESKGSPSLSVEEVDVQDCVNLSNLFSSDVAKLLGKLQRLKVTTCEKIEEVISKGNEEAVDKIAFPQLKSMELKGLQNLRSFYNGIHPVELSFLKDLQFDESNFQLKIFLFECSLNVKEMCINGTDYSKMGNHFTNDTIKEQMLNKVSICCVEHFLIMCQLPHEDSSSIRDLLFTKCEKLLDVIPWNLITSLQKLEKLVVKKCDSVEKIFEYERVNTEDQTSITIFSHLEEITLEDLKNLKHIFNKIPKRILGFQKLEKLVVKRCASVLELFEFEEEESVTTFSHLDTIILEYLENLKHIFTKIPDNIVGFQKLRKLHVENCNNLRNIFSVWSVKGLVQLQQLEVAFCTRLEEIVAKQEKEEEEAIVFPKLRSINVLSCPKLECFYSGKRAIELPVLKSLSIFSCDAIQTFSNGLLSTPNLHKIAIDFMNHPCNGDLNAALSSK
ncbi:uncharacterized protein [Euphorbia lathyris]|uniref:uncharacterized protein isoform X3 n=1 Tax=Euphorbia lathyris TaxID=212925 RepID=UPI003313A124